jgi:hypothetical protein
VNVYYHFYSGERKAAVEALKEIFDWCDTQPLVPICTTDHIRSVQGFISTEITKVDKGWEIQSSGQLKTLRFEHEPRHPKVGHSTGILGYRHEENLLYIHLTDADEHHIRWTATPEPHLNNATVVVNDWSLHKDHLSITFWGQRPGQITFKHLPHPLVQHDEFPIETKGDSTTIRVDPRGAITLKLPWSGR